MSVHSYSRVWLHLTWATLERRPLLFKGAAAKLSGFLSEYAAEKGIYMKINYVNPDHVHTLIDLPTHLCIEDVMQLLKGGSSHSPAQRSVQAGAQEANSYHLIHSALLCGMKLIASCCRTPELSDAGGPARPNSQLTWPARVRSSDFVGHQRGYSSHVACGSPHPRWWKDDERCPCDVHATGEAMLGP